MIVHSGRYGPHDPATAPTTVTVPCAGRYPVCGRVNHPPVGRHDVVLPIPRAVVQLRQQLNNRAHKEGANQ